MLPGAALNPMLLEMKSESRPLNNLILPFDFCVYFYCLSLKLSSDKIATIYTLCSDLFEYGRKYTFLFAN